MNFDEFKEKCMETAIKRDDCYNLLYASNAICGEAGELANYVKKEYRDGVNYKSSITKEIFDIMWYCAYLVDILKIDFDTVLMVGFEKLRKRNNGT
jgi:NTP pyrophosphatase (non-canonical NTP hydrolase)